MERSMSPVIPTTKVAPSTETILTGPETVTTTQPHASTAYLTILSSALLAACSGSDDGTDTQNNTGVGADTASEPRGTKTVQQADTLTVDSLSSAAGFNNFPRAKNTKEAARFLLQSQLNASDSEIAAVMGGTFAGYLQKQFIKPIGQTGWDWLEARGYGESNIHNYLFYAYPADCMIWNQLFTAQDSMRKRMALTLSEFFVASLQTAEFNWRSHAYAQYWDTLASHAFGNFRQLLEAITLNPAMGYFLNIKGSLKENITTSRQPDENYAREVMQLFTIGLYQLNLDGTEKVDSNNKKIESYTQSDVSNLARVFTGYDFDNAVGKASVDIYNGDGSLVGYKADSRDSVRRPMALNASNHSNLEAHFLDANIPAGTPGGLALQTALNTLFNHPNVGPFFGKQMIQRLVTSNPSPAYVARVAAAFNNNGAGVRGDLKAVWVAIFLDDEAHVKRPATDKIFGKLREPMLRFIQWGRSFGLTSEYPSWKIPDTSSSAERLGQSPLRAPSVFNYFRPGFVPPSTALARTKTLAPEFQLVNETTVAGYLNFMQYVIRSGIYSSDPEVPQQSYNTFKVNLKPTYSKELALVADPIALMNRLNLILCAGQLSTTNQTLMVDALTSMPVNAADTTTLQAQKLDRIGAAILMVMASSEYLVQK
jgi:uncharacterized protein (DUF1800 family)